MNETQDSICKNWFSKDQTTTLKGICILLVFLHHFSQYISYQKYSTFLFVIGPAAVDVFYFIAGYATILQLEKASPSELKYFLYNRAIRVYLPITIFTLTTESFLTGLLYMYIVSWIAYKFLKAKNRLLFIFLMNLLFIIICMIFNADIWWYDRFIPYSFGAFFAYNKEQMADLLSNKIARFGILALAPFTVILCGKEMGRWSSLYLIAATLISVYICLFVIALDYMTNFVVRPLAFFGTISFEFFMIHQRLFPVVYKLVPNHYLFLLASLVASTIVACLAHFVWDIIVKKLSLIKGKS